MARRYWSHRRAYAPRLWPMLAAAMVVNVVIGLGRFALWGPGPVWLGPVLGAATALVIVMGRFAIWRRRHPVISPEEYARDIADRYVDVLRKAPWN